MIIPFYSLIYLIICNWFQLIQLFPAFIYQKKKTYIVVDKWITETVRKKSGLRIRDLTIIKDQKLYGMMLGFPFWPKMVLSEGLYKSFDRDELEWVILHEAGHCAMWHNLKAATIQISILILGLWSIYYFQLSFFNALIVIIISGLICIQLIRYLVEMEADKYSIGFGG